MYVEDAPSQLLFVLFRLVILIQKHPFYDFLVSGWKGTAKDVH